MGQGADHRREPVGADRSEIDRGILHHGVGFHAGRGVIGFQAVPRYSNALAAVRWRLRSTAIAVSAMADGTKIWSWFIPATTLQLMPAVDRAAAKAAVRPTAARPEWTCSVIQAQGKAPSRPSRLAMSAATMIERPSASLIDATKSIAGSCFPEGTVAKTYLPGLSTGSMLPMSNSRLVMGGIRYDRD